MKKALFIILMVLAIMPIFAAGQQELKKEITYLASPYGAGDNRLEIALAKFAKDFPDVSVKTLYVDLSDGSTLTMDAMLAAGKAPNIYNDTMVRASKYMVPEYALPLNNYVRDLDKYTAGVLEPFKTAGQLLALPTPGGAQGMCINLDIMHEIGYTVPDRWTIADFLEMAEKVKQFYGGKKYATGMFAANQSGDYLINNWFASFGANRYAPGDYSKTIINQGEAGVKTYEFFQHLADSGYIPPGSATLNDDDYAADWAKGLYAATAFFPAWMNGYWDTAIEQKQIVKPFEVKYVPFPRSPDVQNVPTYFSGGGIVVHKTGTIADTWAARFAEYLNDADTQGAVVPLGYVATRTDVKIKSDNPYVAQVELIVKAGGLQDVGLTSPKFAATRTQHFPVLQKVLNKTETPRQAIDEYAARLNEVLK